MSIRARKVGNVTISKAAAYDTILRPIITEKATLANENGQVTFAVPVTATKPEIKAAVEMLFDVEVKAVNTILLKGKTSSRAGPQRTEHELLEPTYSAASRSSTSRACAADDR